MKILNIAGYKFITLHELKSLRSLLLDECRRLPLKGTILLSTEGINLNLAGDEASIQSFKQYLGLDSRFSDIRFHESYSLFIPFQKLKIKLKKEIITLRQPEIDAVAKRAPSLQPEELKQWLDEGRDITLLDTRNDYEIERGTFTQATHLQLADFSQLPATLDAVQRDKPVVMFCTGGIRCEKAALYMQAQGYERVYQLDGGILGYFAKVGGAHYQGECFVFDERKAVDAGLMQATFSDAKHA